MTARRPVHAPINLRSNQYGVILTVGNTNRIDVLLPNAKQDKPLDAHAQALVGAAMRLNMEPGFDEKCRRAMELFFEPPQGTG